MSTVFQGSAVFCVPPVSWFAFHGAFLAWSQASVRLSRTSFNQSASCCKLYVAVRGNRIGSIDAVRGSAIWHLLNSRLVIASRYLCNICRIVCVVAPWRVRKCTQHFFRGFHRFTWLAIGTWQKSRAVFHKWWYEVIVIMRVVGGGVLSVVFGVACSGIVRHFVSYGWVELARPLPFGDGRSCKFSWNK